MATKREIEARIRFCDLIAMESQAEYPINPRVLADLICRHGVTYAKLQEMNCNGVGTWYGESNESFNKRQARHEAFVEKREQQIEARITAICAQLGAGFAPIFGGDPRGSTIKIKVPSTKTTDFGGEGISVPTS